MNTWLIRNDEKNYYYPMKAKNLHTLRRRILSAKETIIGRGDRLSGEYKRILEQCK